MEEGLTNQPNDRLVAIRELVEGDCVADLDLHRLGEGRGNGYLIVGVGEFTTDVDQETLCCGRSRVQIPDGGVSGIFDPDPGLAEFGDRCLRGQLAQVLLNPFVDISGRREHLKSCICIPEIGLSSLLRGEAARPDHSRHDHTERDRDGNEENQEDRPLPVPLRVLHRHLVGGAASTHDCPLIGCRRS